MARQPVKRSHDGRLNTRRRILALAPSGRRARLPGCLPQHPECAGRYGRSPRTVVPGTGESGAEVLLPAGLGSCTGLYVAVRRIGGADGSAQVRRTARPPQALCDVVCAGQGYVEVQTGAGCKTVGSAYVGSNPTPATTCENGPLAAETRPGGPFSSCHAMYQGVSPWVDARQWLRTYSGQRPGKTSGAYNRSLLRFVGRRPVTKTQTASMPVPSGCGFVDATRRLRARCRGARH